MICKLSNKETDQCMDVNQDCRHCDYGLDIFLEKMGVKPLTYQRELLHKFIKHGQPIYIIPGQYGRMRYLRMVANDLLRILMEDENDSRRSDKSSCDATIL